MKLKKSTKITLITSGVLTLTVLPITIGIWYATQQTPTSPDHKKMVGRGPNNDAQKVVQEIKKSLLDAYEVDPLQAPLINELSRNQNFNPSDWGIKNWLNPAGRITKLVWEIYEVDLELKQVIASVIINHQNLARDSKSQIVFKGFNRAPDLDLIFKSKAFFPLKTYDVSSQKINFNTLNPQLNSFYSSQDLG